MKRIFLILFAILNFANAQDVQWAHEVLEFSSELTGSASSANQVLGRPSAFPQKGTSYCAWVPAKGDKSPYVKVSFEKPQTVQQIIIAENFNAGAIWKIFLYDESEKEFLVYTSNTFVKREPSLFSIPINQTTYKVASLKLVLDGIKIPAPEIDAIGISSTKNKIEAKINFVENSIKATPINLGKTINTELLEILPVIAPDGKTLYFDRKFSDGNAGGKTDSDDIWYSDLKSDGTWDEAKNLGKAINNSSPNAVCGITPDGNMILLAGAYPDAPSNSGLCLAYKEAEGWGKPQGVKIDKYKNESNYVDFCLSNSAKAIIMSINNGDSYGQNDLFVSFRKTDNTWTKPLNLGKNINSAESEMSPFLASDEKTLYFSSAGHSGFGKRDLYISRRLDSTWTNWSEPQNLGPNINTDGDDAYYTIPASGQFAYFVSTKNSIGTCDIFKIDLPDWAKPKPVVLVSGKVFNSKTKLPIGASIYYEDLKTGQELGIARSNPKDGSYKIVLPAGSKYGFRASADGYLSTNENLDLTTLTSYKEIEKNLYLAPIEVGTIVRLNNIFFDTGKADLKTDSYSELNRLITSLKEKPTIKIEIGGHTDNTGNITSNLELSKKRAQSVYIYLIENGIDKERIVAKGYGQEKPVADNKTEAGMQQNRRVEVKILNN